MAPNTEISMRALIVTLKSPVVGLSSADIFAKTGVSISSINRIYAKAIERGFDPNIRPFVIKDKWVQDAPRSGRPQKQTSENINNLIAKVRNSRYGRELNCADLAGAFSAEGIDISAMTIWRMLRKAGFRKTKPTRKPGLTKKMRDDRLKWCIAHKDWTLEDWKWVIWSDETSVVLLYRRGGYRIWRKAEERFLRSCIRERWKGYSEFMFWGCFSYDQKGPCHCWLPETKAEKEQAEKDIEEWNRMLEPMMHDEWELQQIKRLGLITKPGPKPQWRWNKKNGKLVRESKGGIDWYRYQTKIIVPKLIPFAKRLGSKAIVQEDGAPSHAHHAQQRIYDIHQVRRLLWPGNSPDLNMIEPCWMFMKRETTKKGAPKSRAEAIRAWERCWKENVTQERIQAWIERIMEHIQQVIRCEGGNEYQEGRKRGS